MGEEVCRNTEEEKTESEEEESDKKTIVGTEQEGPPETSGQEIITYIRKPYPEAVEEYLNTLRLKRKIFWGVDKEDVETQIEILCTLWQREKRKSERKYRRLTEEVKQMKEKQVKDREERLLLRERALESRAKRRMGSHRKTERTFEKMQCKQGTEAEHRCVQLQKRNIISWLDRLKNRKDKTTY